VPDELISKHVPALCLKAKPQVGEIESVRDGEAGRRGARCRKVTFTLDSSLRVKAILRSHHYIVVIRRVQLPRCNARVHKD